jgi:hypothetical protein
MTKRPITPLAMAVPAAKGTAYVPEDLVVETPAPRGAKAPAPAPPLPQGPAGMNFKLAPDASAALRMHQFRTGRTKQAIVEEALNQWLDRNRGLIE